MFINKLIYMTSSVLKAKTSYGTLHYTGAFQLEGHKKDSPLDNPGLGLYTVCSDVFCFH